MAITKGTYQQNLIKYRTRLPSGGIITGRGGEGEDGEFDPKNETGVSQHTDIGKSLCALYITSLVFSTVDFRDGAAPPFIH